MKIVDITPKDISLMGNNEDAIRQLRAPILLAYDKYKIAVVYGEIFETEEEKSQILLWKKKVLDKDVDAISNIPEKIRYYL